MTKTVTHCNECPCFFIDVDDRGENNDRRCTQIAADLHNDEYTSVNELCPLRTEPLLVTLAAN